ncbi:unnamed protein product [Caenorhabditis angaria]|uniref:Rho-GAP domain-containing protein n=1 Tax=Caenorhabditis angaria TaxID=860376 RepID=A0A9P1IQY1_9PELO|nr:unnamed protein product [Caenorhabditis angaria]
MMQNISNLKCVNICVVGVSGPEQVKGACGVGKSLFCNRFVRGAADDFHIDHCSVLSQTDFGGSPVINNDHWLYWGDRILQNPEDSSQILIKLVEQTEFLDDETYEPIASSSKNEDYSKRCARIVLNSRDKLMYIQKEQLGLEADFPQHILSDGKFAVDGFIVIFDVSRNIPQHLLKISQILTNLVKTKKPLIIALTKCDEIDEESKRSVVANLNSRKDLKNLQIVEVSSIHDVNIEEVFHCLVSQISKNYKHKRKPMSYYEAAHYVEQRNIQIKNAYANLLSQMMPMTSWSSMTGSFGSSHLPKTWKRLLADLDRHKDYLNFVQIYGSRAAFRMYEKYMCDAREFWITSRLRALVPQLSRIYASIFEKIEDISSIEWVKAREMIKTHALFDEFFRPIGSLGRQLETLQDDLVEMNKDMRIPAEILILPDAQQVYENFREEIRTLRKREKLEDEFLQLLSETPEVTPGKSLQDASLFLHGASSFENLEMTQIVEIYDKYQRGLVYRAEVEFVEALLENVELLLNIINSTISIDTISIDELGYIKDYLEGDRRYRWMSKIFDLRDHLIYSITNFYRNPNISRCPAGSRCVENSLGHFLDKFFHRRNDQAYTHLIDILVEGSEDDQLVSQFIGEISGFLRGDPFPCSSGSAFIRCYKCSDFESLEEEREVTEIYLIDSLESLERLKEFAPRCPGIPPIFIVLCEPSNYHIIPMLHQHGASLAAKFGANFFGAKQGDSIYPSDDHASTNISSENSFLLANDQLMAICEAICASQLTMKKRDLRTQISIMCGDPISIDLLIQSIFGDFEMISYFRPVIHPNLTAAGLVPIDIQSPQKSSRKSRVELFFTSFHSWFSPNLSYRINSTQAHILVYYSGRPASFCHVKTAICRILALKNPVEIGIFVVAICERQFENDPLAIEGREICESIGAKFLAIDAKTQTCLTDDFVEFFEQQMLGGRQREMAKNEPEYAEISNFSSRTSPNSTTSNNNVQKEFEELGEEHIRPKSLNLIGAGNSSGNGNLILDHRNIKKLPLKMREARISRSGPILMPSRKKPEIQVAPLATPEAIEIAPEYSQVKDALSSSDYETLEFLAENENRKNNKSLLDLPSNSAQDQQHRRPYRNASRISGFSRTTCLSTSPDPSNRLHRTEPIRTPIPTTSRQSMSAESLAELLKNEQKMSKKVRNNRFVRKVATSFRFRKDKLEEARNEQNLKIESSRSLPQSPHLERKKYNPPEKISSAFSWLPSRSPKHSKSQKSSTCELNSSSISSSSTSNSSAAATIQGVIGIDENIETLCKSAENGIPVYVQKCVQFIEMNGGFEQEGLYRVPGNQAHLSEVEKRFLATGEFNVSSVDCPVHVAATALKNFFSCLPEPIIPQEFHQKLKLLTIISENAEKSRKLAEILDEFPIANRKTLGFLIKHLEKVANSPKTVMDLKNLSKVWFPTLFRPSFDTYEALSSGMTAFQLAMEVCFEHGSLF